MRCRIRRLLAIVSCTVGFVSIASAQDGCVADRDGRMVCAEPDATCLQDSNGAVFCSTPGGGIVRDRYGAALCGPGYCTTDQDGRAFCSSAPRGGASTDRDGKAVCSVACVAASAATCVQPKRAD